MKTIKLADVLTALATKSDSPAVGLLVDGGLAKKRTSTDHDTLDNTHNLTTDIDHNTITNYSADRHYKQTTSTIDPTGIPEDGHLYLKVDA